MRHDTREIIQDEPHRDRVHDVNTAAIAIVELSGETLNAVQANLVQVLCEVAWRCLAGGCPSLRIRASCARRRQASSTRVVYSPLSVKRVIVRALAVIGLVPQADNTRRHGVPLLARDRDDWKKRATKAVGANGPSSIRRMSWRDS